jgi:hypothetical protein
MLVVPVGAVIVWPGRGVTAPGVRVSESGVWVARDKVEVGRARAVGVGGTGVAGEAHAVITAVSKANSIDKVQRVFIFIVITSIDNYIL